MTVTLAANVIVQDGALLMLYRDDKEYWELPAGKVENGELPRNAAIREAQEEIGCTVRIKSSLGRLDMDFEHENSEFQVRVFLSDIVEGVPEPQEARFTDMAWMDADDLANAALAPNLAMKRDDLRLFLIRDN